MCITELTIESEIVHELTYTKKQLVYNNNYYEIREQQCYGQMLKDCKRILEPTQTWPQEEVSSCRSHKSSCNVP